MNFEELMLRAVTNAETFKYTAKPNPVVGAILCTDNEIISEGYHEIYGSNHAEINAISNARKHQGKKFNNFSELALVCTLEPCSHVGKTGSCAEQIVETGIKKVVIGSIVLIQRLPVKVSKFLKKTVLTSLLAFMKILSKIRINTFSLSILITNLILF